MTSQETSLTVDTDDNANEEVSETVKLRVDEGQVTIGREISTIEKAFNNNVLPLVKKDQSLRERAQKAKEESNGTVDYYFKVICILVASLGVALIFVIKLIFPIVMITIGTVFLSECPVDRNIPIFLIVGGAVALFHTLGNCCFLVYRRGKSEDDEERLHGYPCKWMVTLFSLAWFITGCVWTYQIYKPNFGDSTSTEYCNETLYTFAFWFVTLNLVLLAAFCLVACCAVCTMACVRVCAPKLLQKQ